MKPNYLKRYIVSSYILVWALIIVVAGTASLVFHAPPVIMWVVRNLIAWSPTYLLLLGWKHFCPVETRTAFVRRGFLREEFNKKYGFLRSAICQGLVWCFWHTLLWAVDSKFTDWRAIPYIISNIAVITSITVLMNLFLERYNNLLYSVLLHFGFNILYVFLDADIGFFVILTVLYLVITPTAVLMRNRTVKNTSA